MSDHHKDQEAMRQRNLEAIDEALAAPPIKRSQSHQMTIHDTHAMTGEELAEIVKRQLRREEAVSKAGNKKRRTNLVVFILWVLSVTTCVTGWAFVIQEGSHLGAAGWAVATVSTHLIGLSAYRNTRPDEETL